MGGSAQTHNFLITSCNLYLSECTGQNRILVYKQKRQLYLKNEKSLVRSRNWWGCLNRQSHWRRRAVQSLWPERRRIWCLVSSKKTTQYLSRFASFYERLSIKKDGKEAKGYNKKMVFVLALSISVLSWYVKRKILNWGRAWAIIVDYCWGRRRK